MIKHPMKLRAYITALHAALFAILLAASPAGAGSMPLLGAGKPAAAGGGGYTGPGDVVASAKAWYGLRAYSAATRGNALVNVCNSTGGTDVGCGDLFSDATTGAMVAATIGGITCPGANCTIKTWYDQTAGGNCTGSCDLTQSGITIRPTLVASCIGSLPCARFIGVSAQSMATAGTFAQAQPLTVSTVAFVPTAGAGILWANSGSFNVQAAALVTPNIRQYAGTVADNAITYNSSHNLASVFDDAGTGSNQYIDAVSHAGSVGTNGFTGAALLIGGAGLSPATLDVFETGLWGSNIGSTPVTNLCHNQFVYWGTATSC
jgi:hypothetical protein